MINKSDPNLWKMGYRTVSILAVPVFRRTASSTSSGQTLAVIQMINKTEFDGEVGKFDDEDIQVMETFATFVASKLDQSSMFGLNTSNEPSSEAGKAFDHLPGQAKADNKAYEASHRNQAIQESFEEGDEEDCDG